jgi:hypothetical protein
MIMSAIVSGLLFLSGLLAPWPSSPIDAATAGLAAAPETLTAQPPKQHDRIQLVDHYAFKLGGPPNDAGGGTPDEMSKLGLPNYNPGSLSDVEARTVYLHGELQMRQLNDQLAGEGVSAEERAETMFGLRNSLRTWVRELMSNRTLAGQFNASEPNLTFEDLVAKYEAKGLTGNEIYNAIIDSSTRSRPSVNSELGVDPAMPPALPPIRPSAPVEAAPDESPPACAPVGCAPIEPPP